MTASSSHAVLPLALVAGTMVLTAAACGGSTGGTPSPSAAGPSASTVTSTAAATAATATATATATVTATPTTSTSSSPAGGGATCGVGSLKIGYSDDKGGGAAGSVYGTLTFTNTGSTSCSLRGFPGVSYVTGSSGTQVGAAATRTEDSPKTKTLAAGASAKAALRRSQPGNYGGACKQTKVAGLRVYPPASTEAAFVAFPTTGCTSISAPLLQIAPVR